MFDIVGILILVVVILVFGSLTLRAWNAKPPWLKWIGALLAGLLTILPAILLILALIGFAKLNQHFNNPVTEIQVSRTSAQVARGEKLANSCASCHSPGNQPPLSGTNFVVKFDFPPMGTLYAPNLTPSGDISGWSDGELIRAIREGVHKNGRSLLIMPADQYRNLSDEDVQALIAFLRSQPSTGGPTPANNFNVLGAIFTNLSDFRTAQQPVGHVSTPQSGTIEYGKYMVDVIGCRSCHGPELQGRVETGQPGPPAGPNLTQIIPHWTEEEFMAFFNTGTLPGGGKVPVITLSSGYSEPRMNWPMVRAVTTDDELKAMYAYLHSLQPIEESAK
jgi:cytochrome c553